MRERIESRVDVPGAPVPLDEVTHLRAVLTRHEPPGQLELSAGGQHCGAALPPCDLGSVRLDVMHGRRARLAVCLALHGVSPLVPLAL
jgi:hypothetical protein